jgi:hypothetical protein
MSANKLSFIEAKQIPITEYLTGLGFEPAKIRGEDYWYHSPFREERTPSFKVNAKLNVWYDHGTGEGGTILDLGAKLHHCTLAEFLEKLTERSYGLSFHSQPPAARKPENKLEIISAYELISPGLLHYLGTRGIAETTGKAFCKEIDFRIGPRMYKAIGFPNRSGAYELRNSWFKGSSSPKDITLIDNHSERISVLEGFMDFLSVMQFDHKELKDLRQNSNFLVLNSLRLLGRSLPTLRLHKEVNLFLDNDLAAKEAKGNLQKHGICFYDASTLYREHKDVNEYLVAINKIGQSKSLPQARSKGMRR